MIAQTRMTIPRTHVDRWPQSTLLGPVQADVPVHMTIWLHSAAQEASLFDRAETLSCSPLRARTYDDRAALEAATAAHTADLARVQTYCDRYHIEVLNARWRCIEARAPLTCFIEAFGANVATYVDPLGRTFRGRTGALTADSTIAPLIHGVFGFSQWPKARRLGALQRHLDPLPLDRIVARYRFPDATGKGQTIGIVQMGGNVQLDDFERCMQAQGIERAAPEVVRLDDAAAAHAIATSQDLEAALDAQIIGALAPGAQLVVYRGPDSERAFIDTVRTAIFDGKRAPSILSISYGWAEQLWTPCAIEILNELFAIAALTGVSVFCASGDNGAELDDGGKPHVLFPASSPFVHACGATTIANETNESAWTGSGGGFSERFETPAWQRPSRAPDAPLGRGIPDVAAQESPGYRVYLQQAELSAGGTSAVAPMWAALVARLNERLGHCAGLFTPLLYESHGALDPIVDGSNGYYTASKGWNACTGLGVPNGSGLESLFRA